MNKSVDYYKYKDVLEKIGKTKYAVYGTGEYAKNFVKSTIEQNIVPELILDYSPNEESIGGIQVRDIRYFQAGTMPIVLASKRFRNEMRKKIIYYTRGYNTIIDLYVDKPKHDRKVFCIGYGKTGTTSLEKVLRELGYIMGNQGEAEMLIFDWAEKRFDRIIEFCRTADAFQDIPFWLDEVFVRLDRKFPNSKFILTIRKSGEEWFSSLCCHVYKKFIENKKKLSIEEALQSAEYRYPGYVYDSHTVLFGRDLFDKEKYINKYRDYNEKVIDYFKHRQDDLLVLNLSEENAYFKLCEFLDKKPIREAFPILNKNTVNENTKNKVIKFMRGVA